MRLYSILIAIIVCMALAAGVVFRHDLIYYSTPDTNEAVAQAQQNLDDATAALTAAVDAVPAAETKIETAQAKVTNLEQELDLLKSILPENKSAYEAAQAEIDAAQKVIAQAEDTKSAAQAQIAAARQRQEEAGFEYKEDVVQEAQVVSVLVQPSMEQSVTAGIVLRGQTAASKSVLVKAETQGAVISQPIRKGTLVTRGQLLCELEVGTKAAAVAEAQARLVEAQGNADAATKLVEQGFASETQAKNREAQLEAAIAGLDRAQSDLENTKILAPFDGLLESDTAELGEFMQPGAPCATVLALDPIKLVGFATELQVGQIALGSPAGARLIDGSEVLGQVSFVSRSADPNTRTFLVEVTVPNSDLAIRDGATAEIYIALDGVLGHLLPQSALTLNGDGALGVRLAIDGVAYFNAVNVIRDAPEGIWVNGLPAQADVIVLGQEYVTDGSLIKVSYKE